MDFDALVIGSKPKSVIPNFLISKIYTANGAAERAKNYQKKFPKTSLTCLVGDLEFEKNINVRVRITEAFPDRMIVRGKKIHLPEKLKTKCELKYLSFTSQLKFQSKFFQGGNFTVIYSEFFREIKTKDKIKYFLKNLKKLEFQGVSTGFFSILKALDENPNSNILITGIGMSGGKQFYTNERNKSYDYTARSRVDRFLIKKLKNEYKKNIYTTDEDLHLNGNIKLWR
tara:strand:- start:7892 stop:8575 length:684 start_codon:yes stop_codon:yes gene_type:complete